MSSVLNKLKGGDRRSIGRVDEVVSEVLQSPELFDELFHGMLIEDPVLSMRAADAVEKITRERPKYLVPYKNTLLDEVAQIDQQEVRWHFAQMVPRLPMDAGERDQIFEILVGYLDDRSKIVQVFSLQAMVEIAQGDVALQARAVEILEEIIKSSSPAVKNRGRRLLKSLRGER